MLRRYWGKMGVRKRRAWEAWIWLLIIALAAEITVFNFSAWRSRFFRSGDGSFKEVSVEGAVRIDNGETPVYMVEEGMLSMHVTGVDAEIHNLGLDLYFPEPDLRPETVPYKVSISDEGNHYAYVLPEQVWMPELSRTHYVNLHTAGKVSEIGVEFAIPAGSVVEAALSHDVPVPFVFHIGRWLMAWAVLCLVYYAWCIGRGRLEAGKWIGCRRQKLITAAVILLLAGMAWKLAHVNPVCIAAPWPHHRQYQELAEAMAEGSFRLAAAPSEGLLLAENPYDTIYLQANGIHYQADYAYFEGGYYVYFGVVPELLLYLPYYLLTGHHLSNYLAVYIFYCGFLLAVFALYREIVKRWFVNTPFFLYIMACVLTVCSGNYLFVAARPDMYDTPIMAANMFTAAGLWLWIKGKYLMHTKWKRLAYLSGSFCMALVAGCRPQMLLFSFLAVPLFWEEVVKKRELFGKKNLLDTFCICFPYMLTAAGIMYYNAARFGSPFDFGATYSLTSNDMTKRGFNMHQTLLGLWHYFLQIPSVSSEFPFIKGMQIESGTYMGRLNAEYTYGGLLACNAFAWLLVLLRREKRMLKYKGVYAFTLTSLAVPVLIGVVDVTGAGILQRYMVDMVWGILMAAVFVLFAVWEVSNGTERKSELMLLLMGICLLQAVYGLGVVMGNGDLSVNVRSSNPELYYRVKSLLLF